MFATIRAGIIVWAMLITTAAGAQSAPTLHSRSDRSPSPRPALADGHSTLPGDASGEYEMDDKGSVAQITIEHDHVTGYITKMEQGAALTLFFEHAAVNGNRVSFDTRVVHGLHYLFDGEIVRGSAAIPSRDGFYRLTGELKIVRKGAQETKHVSFESTPRDIGHSQ